jgi:hypothetical protein
MEGWEIRNALDMAEYGGMFLMSSMKVAERECVVCWREEVGRSMEKTN